MANDETILELARAVRPYLHDLMGEQSVARGIDDDLAEFLRAASAGNDVELLILHRLEEQPALHEWAAHFLERGYPPEVAADERAYGGLPGLGEVTSVPKFRCPEADFVFYRLFVGQPVPDCPTHRISLHPADQ